MRLESADIIFSKIVRARDKFRCQRCNKFYPEGKGLQCSHFYGRVNRSTRFDLDNAETLCHGCHRYFDETNREAYRDFKLKKLGQKKFDALKVRANMSVKKDKELELIFVFIAVFTFLYLAA